MADEGRAEDVVTEPLTPEQMDRYAGLVAAGEAELPDGLLPEQEDELIRKVRDRLRRQFVIFVARQIARDVRSASERPVKETTL